MEKHGSDRETLRRFVDNLPGLAYRCAPEPPWEMSFIGGEVEALTGYPVAAFERGAVAYGEDVVLDADLPEVTAAVRAGVAAGEQFTARYRIDRADGERRHVFERGTPVVEDGEVVALEGVVVDVTERNEQERRRREERAFLQSTLAALPDLFYALDPDGSFRRWNERLTEVTGYDDATLAETDPLALFPPGERDRVAAAIDRVLDDRQQVTLAASLRTADGGTVPYEFTGAPLTGPDGELRGLVGIGRDISALRRRERQLRLFDRLFRHNLRNDLTTIRGYAEELVGRLDGEAGETAALVRDAADGLVRDSETARQLTQLTLEDERTQRPLALSTVVERAAETVRERFPGAAVETAVPAALAVAADGRLTVAVEELLVNAAEHGRPADGTAPTVRVTAERDGERVRLVVTDDGPGVPDEEWAVVVGDAAVTQLSHGSGLGLPLVRLVAEQYGGSFERRRGGDREGVVLSLPAADPAPE